MRVRLVYPPVWLALFFASTVGAEAVLLEATPTPAENRARWAEVANDNDEWLGAG